MRTRRPVPLILLLTLAVPVAGSLLLAGSAAAAAGSRSHPDGVPVIGAPVVSSFSPTAGQVGAGVTITGSHFTGATAVRFNGVTAKFNLVSDTQIMAKVPRGALTGPISVTNASGTGTSTTNFRVKPTITSFSPTSGPVGTLVTIGGYAFTNTTRVSFNGIVASFTIVSYAKVEATVPAGASTGPITVKTDSGKAVSKTSFTVT